MTALEERRFTAQWWRQGTRGEGVPRRFHSHLSKQAKGATPPPSLSPSPQCSPQSLGRATLAEAKFTFLCGAWGCVQSQGSVGQE